MGFPKDLALVEPVPVLAFEDPKHWMGVCVEHTHFSRMSEWTQITRGCVGRSVAMIRA